MYNSRYVWLIWSSIFSLGCKRIGWHIEMSVPNFDLLSSKKNLSSLSTILQCSLDTEISFIMTLELRPRPWLKEAAYDGDLLALLGEDGVHALEAVLGVVFLARVHLDHYVVARRLGDRYQVVLPTLVLQIASVTTRLLGKSILHISHFRFLRLTKVYNSFFFSTSFEFIHISMHW